MKQKQITYAVSLAVAALMTSMQGNTAQAVELDHILVQGASMNAALVDETQEKGGYIYGVVGGGVYIDSYTTRFNATDDKYDIVRGGLTGTLGHITSILGSDSLPFDLPEEVKTLLDTANSVLTEKTESAQPGHTELSGNTGLMLEDYKKNWIRYYGAIGGDFSVNTVLGGSFNLDILNSGSPNSLMDPSESTYFTRNGNISNEIKSGTVIGGAGASAAAALGNINIIGSASYSNVIDITANMTMNGETSVTVDGSVETTADPNANLIGWTNGGLAVGLGGNAASTVTGNSTITINGAGRTTYESPDDFEDPAKDGIPPLTTAINVMKGSKVNAIGVTGGGTSISTMGGTATSTVDGSTTVTIDNATVIGAAGGGVAASVDLTTIADLVYASKDQHLATGNDNGHLDVTLEQVASLLKMDINSLPEDLKEAKVTATNAINGGTAKSEVKGATNINLTGSTTAVGVMGGGIAAAVHTYAWKGDKTEEGDNTVGSVYGSSTATASTGRSTITIDLNGKGDPAALSEAIQNMYTGFDNDSTQADALSGLKDQGMAVAVFGGGTAVAYGNPTGTMKGSDSGANAAATTEGSDIYLKSGYAAGVFGGGAALAINSAHAKAEMASDDPEVDSSVNIYTASGMKTVALVGGGLAWSGEEAPNTETNFMDSASATSTVGNVNIHNNGDTDGIFGGGVALGVSNRTGANDAISSVKTSNIDVSGGTVSTVNMDVLMGALKNHNIEDPDLDDNYPYWSFMGFNVSSYMADIKGILDDTAIVGGGLGLGLSGYADVTDSSITINGGTVEGSILGGGIAIDNMNEGSGAHVKTSTITLNGGTVTGSIYAGGAINKTTSDLVKYETENTASLVDEAIVTLNGTDVKGEISGQGIEVVTNYNQIGNYNPFNDNDISYTKANYDDSVGKSTLVITGRNTLTALASGNTYVRSSKIHDFNDITVKAGSETVLKDFTAGGAALIDGGHVTTHVSVDPSALLYITDLANSDTAYSLAVNTTADSTFWASENVIYNRLNSYVEVKDTGTSFTVTKSAIDTDEKRVMAAEGFANDLGAGPVYNVIQSGYDNNWEVREGARNFFRDWGMNPGAREDFGRAALLGEDTAVTANTVAIARAVTDNLTSRLSYIGDFATAPEAYGERGAVWAEYIRNDFKADGLSSSFGDIDADGDFNGVMAGADFAVIGGMRLGAAVYYVNGDSDGTISENDYDGYGFALYGNYRNDDYDFNIIGDIGYGRVSHDIEGRLNGRKLDADRDLDVFTVGVKAEKRFQVAENCYVVPYTGIRYFNINAKDYDTKYGGQKLFDNEVESQSIWTLPLGVSTTHAFKLQSGWTVYPKFDVAYIWAFGDKDNDVKVDMGTGAHSALNYKVVDDGSWRGAIGVDASYGTWGFALGYAYQQGSDIRDQKFFANMSYAF